VVDGVGEAEREELRRGFGEIGKLWEVRPADAREPVKILGSRGKFYGLLLRRWALTVQGLFRHPGRLLCPYGPGPFTRRNL